MLDYGWLDEDNNVIPCSFEEYIKHANGPNKGMKRVNYFEKGGVSVSTVFLGMDHSGCWFETCIFDKREGATYNSDISERYEIYEQAAEKHHKHVGHVLTCHNAVFDSSTYSNAQLDFIGRKCVPLDELGEVDQFTFDMLA